MQIATFGIQNGEHKNCRWSEKESSDYITQKRQSELFAVKNTFGMYVGLDLSRDVTKDNQMSFISSSITQII